MHLHKTIITIVLLLATTLLQAQQPAQHSVLSQGDWYKMSIAETGVYRLTTTDLSWLSGKAVNQIAVRQ